MFWSRKSKCNHEWHYLADDFITNSWGSSVEADRACWIFCVNCEKEDLVHKGKWERISKRQEIVSGRSGSNLKKVLEGWLGGHYDDLSLHDNEEGASRGMKGMGNTLDEDLREFQDRKVRIIIEIIE